MTLRSLQLLKVTKAPNGLVVMVAALGLGFVGAVLAPGLHLAGKLVDSTIALNFIGEQQRYPTIVRVSLDSLRDRLADRGFIQDSSTQLRNAASKLGTALPALTGKHAATAAALWAAESAALKPLIAYAGVPYSDSETSGTVLNASGQQLERDVAAAIHTSRRTLPQLDAELMAIAADLQSSNALAAQQLRIVMLGGLAIAGTLIVLVLALLRTRKRQETHLQQARQQTVDILRTVKDGLFLLDKDLVIGTAYSAALETLFQRKDVAGVAFQDLLKGIVSEKTLATALKFVTVLWAERTNEKLVKSINPLGEVEVHLDVGNGRFETRFLQFEFHRVRIEGKITHVLVCVSDVTTRVELAQELKSSQNQAQGQIDTLVGILHIDPLQLGSFLNDSNAAMKMINTVLREPAREEAVFRKKLDTLFRQVHSVKGEAAALGLSSIESRAHSFEDDLKTLREKPDLSGNDFLPLVIKLDDLLTHLQSVGELVSRLSRLQPAATGADPVATAVIQHRAAEPATDEAGSDLRTVLQKLAARVAADNDKQAAVQCEGFAAIPNEYRRLIKDVAIQAVRNAVVHGLEAPAARLAVGKPARGTVTLRFHSLGDLGYKFTVEDDGGGLAVERIKEVAIDKGLITPEQAPTLQPKEIYTLLFKPGFSTAENTTKDAGRGVGMNLVADLTRQAGGRVGIATTQGRFTRLTITVPCFPAKSDDDIAVA